MAIIAILYTAGRLVVNWRLTLVMGCMCLFGGHTVQASAPSEYQLKAAFLYNVARMIDWPDKDNKRAFVICIIGENPFGDALDSIKNRDIKKRPLQFIANITIGQAGQCDILFVSQAAQDLLGNILAQVERKHIVTISDNSDFTARGGMVGLIKVGERINIEVNLRAVKNANISVSSRLLTLAKIVDE